MSVAACSLVTTGYAYRRLLLDVLASGRLGAEICPHTAVPSTVDAPTRGRLCVEGGQFGGPPLQAGLWRCIVVGLGIPAHQALAVVAAVLVLIVVRVGVESVGKGAVLGVGEGVVGQQAARARRRGARVERRGRRGGRPLLLGGDGRVCVVVVGGYLRGVSARSRVQGRVRGNAPFRSPGSACWRRAPQLAVGCGVVGKSWRGGRARV